MSLSAISSNPLTGSAAASFHLHRKGAHGVNSSATTPASSNSGAVGNTSGVTIGQLPVGASSPLFNNILQSLQQTVGAQTAVTAATSSSAAGTTAAAGSTEASSGTAASVHAFMHTLFQALKQDGFEPGSTTASSAAAPSATPSSSASSISSTLVSSLKTLIGQVGSGAAVTPAAASLSAAYQALVGASGSAASSANGAASSSGGGLQHFLGNLLQNLQGGGVHALSAVGNNVNANV